MALTLRDKIIAKELVRGAIVAFPSETIVELVVAAGFDFVVIDTEHGSISPESVASMIRAARSFGSEAIVRVSSNDRGPIQVALDAGASGVQVPMVETAEDAARIVRYARYAPQGNRGVAGNRGAGYLPMDAERSRDVNDSILVIAQIETVTGVQNAARIAAVGGVDVVFVGTSDLSQSLGATGQVEAPSVLAAIEEVALAAAGMNLGIFAKSADSALRLRKHGFTLFEAAAIPLIAAAFEGFASGFSGATTWTEAESRSHCTT